MASAHLALALACLAVFAGVSTASSNRPVDFLSNIPADAGTAEDYSIIETLYETHIAPTDTFFNDSASTGHVFIPNDAAFTKFLTALQFEASDLKTEFVQAVLSNHIVLDSPSDGEGEMNFTSLRQPNGEVVVTYGDDGNITSVKPLNTAPPSFAQSSSVLASWSTTGSGNATIFFVDGVIMSSSVYDEFIDNTAKNFTAAAIKVSLEADGTSPINTLMTVLGLSGQSELLQMFSQPAGVTNGTLFAPVDSAFADLIGAVGGGADAATLDSTQGMKDLTSAILQYHFVPVDVARAAAAVEGGVTLTTALLDLNYTVASGAVIMAAGGNATVVEGFADAKLITPDGYAESMSPVAGVVHAIDTVLLPVDPSENPPNLAGFAERAPAGATFNNFTAALGLIGPVNMAVNGPTLRGAIFMPTDEAFASFFGSVDGVSIDNIVRSTTLLRQVLYEHIIFDDFLTGESSTYNTWADESMDVTSTTINVTVDERGYPMKFEKAEGAASNLPTESTILAWSLQNANGFVADTLNNGFGSGRIYFVDQVIISQDTADLAGRLASPSGDRWANAFPEANQFDTVRELLGTVAPELQDLIDSNDPFTMFMPTERAFSTLAESFGFQGDLRSLLRGNAGLVNQMLSSYTVLTEDFSTTENRTYTTRQDGVSLTYDPEEGTITLIENGSNRKLSESPASGSVGNAVEFLTGQRMFAMNGAPLTPQQRDLFQGVIDGAASMPVPSFALLLATLASIIALLGL